MVQTLDAHDAARAPEETHDADAERRRNAVGEAPARCHASAGARERAVQSISEAPALAGVIHGARGL